VTKYLNEAGIVIETSVTSSEIIAALKEKNYNVKTVINILNILTGIKSRSHSLNSNWRHRVRKTTKMKYILYISYSIYCPEE